jgi:hypothetical protein
MSLRNLSLLGGAAPFAKPATELSLLEMALIVVGAFLVFRHLSKNDKVKAKVSKAKAAVKATVAPIIKAVTAAVTKAPSTTAPASPATTAPASPATTAPASPATTAAPKK